MKEEPTGIDRAIDGILNVLWVTLWLPIIIILQVVCTIISASHGNSPFRIMSGILMEIGLWEALERENITVIRRKETDESESDGNTTRVHLDGRPTGKSTTEDNSTDRDNK